MVVEEVAAKEVVVAMIGNYHKPEVPTAGVAVVRNRDLTYWLRDR